MSQRSAFSLLSLGAIAFALYMLWSANSQYYLWNNMPGSTDHPAHPAPYGTIVGVGMSLLLVVIVQSVRIDTLERALKNWQMRASPESPPD